MFIRIRTGLASEITRRIQRKVTDGFVLVACLSVALQPLLVDVAFAQEIIIDPNGNVGFQPSMQRVSRPQVVDVARPNAGGVSHNRYSRFDVPAEGAVLNNSQGATDTHVAGVISGNPNLVGGTAATILNEVTSTDYSDLNGAIEVAGDRADVIIANPNGISCSGCSFINAGSGTLTTGTPVVNGSDVLLYVRGGTVTIGRNGLRGEQGSRGQIQNINLIGRTVVIDGKVTAIDGINVQGGAQRYDLTNESHFAAQSGSGTAPDILVDGTEFGAMEAGRIQIIGNEDGLGVRTLGAVRSSSGNVNIVARGDARVRSVSAHGQADIRSTAGNVTLERDISSATAATVVSAQGDLETTDRTGLYGLTGVDISALSGDLTFDGDLQSGASAELFAKNQLHISGYSNVAEIFTLNGENTVSIEGATIVADQVASGITPGTFRLSDAAIFSTQDLLIETGEFQLGQNVLVDSVSETSASNLVVVASSHFRNGADLRLHDSASITYSGNFYNEVGGVLEEANLRLSGDREVHNAGVLYGTQSIDLDVTRLFNAETGTILSNSVEIDTIGILENKGTIVSEGGLALNSANEISNEGYIQAIRATLTGPEFRNTENAELRVQEQAQVTATTRFSNDGILASLADLNVDAGQFLNSGIVSVGNTLDVSASTLRNDESLTAGSSITLLTTGNLTNNGNIASYGGLSLTSGSVVENTGRLLVDGNLFVYGPRFDNRGEEALVRALNARLRPRDLRNSGQILLVDDVEYRDLDRFENHGVFATQGSIELRGRNTSANAIFGSDSVLISGLQADDSSQALLAGKNSNITFENMVLDGRVSTGGNLTITGGADLIVRDTLQAGQNIILTADEITVTDEAQVLAVGTGKFNASGGLLNEGVISLGSYLNLGSGFGDFRNAGVIAAAGTDKFTLVGDFTNAGTFQVSNRASIEAANVSNTGVLQAVGNVSLNAQGRVENLGNLSTVGQVQLNGSTIDLGSGSHLNADLLKVRGSRFYNRGFVNLTSEGRNEWVLTDALHQYGITYAAGEVRLEANALSTYEDSLLSSAGTLSLTIGDRAALTNSNVANLRGALSSKTIALTAQAIAGTDTSSIFASEDIRLTAGDRISHFGEMAAGEDLILESARFELRGNTYGPRITIEAESEGVSRGNVFAGETLQVFLNGTLDNYGLLEARDKLTLSTGHITNHSAAKFSSTEIDLRSTGRFNNQGEVAAASTVSIKTAGRFTNEAAGTVSGVTFGLTADEAFNRGAVDVYGFFGNVAREFNNFSTIETETYFGLTAGSLRNRQGATLSSQGHLYITSSGALENDALARISGQFVDLRVAALTNNGAIRAQDVVNIADVSGDINNTETGTIYGTTIALLSNKTVRNFGIIGQTGSDALPQAEAVNIFGKRSVDNHGRVSARDLRLVSEENIYNRATASLQAENVLGIKSYGELSNSGEMYGEDVIIEARAFDNFALIRGDESILVAARNFSSTDGNSREANIASKVVVLDVENNVTNGGRLSGHDALAISSGEGRITNSGEITGADIRILASRGNFTSSTRIEAGDELAIEAQGISLGDRVEAADSIFLNATKYDLLAAGRIETSELIVEAAGDILANEGVFRGTARTQVVADDILSTNGNNIINTKLSSLGGPQTDIFVRLREGDIGLAPTSEAAAAVVPGEDGANLNASGSITLLSDFGDIVLGGTISATQDVYMSARGDLTLVGANVSAGNILHLEGKARAKSYLNSTIHAGNQAQIVQEDGWFYTDQWLNSTDIDFDLAVQAKRIVVNSSHRFVGRDVVLWASEDIRQNDQIISARQVTYSAGRDIRIKFDPFAWRAANINASPDGNYWDVETAGMRGYSLLSQGRGTEIYAGRDILLTSGRINTAGTLSLTAGRDIVSQPLYVHGTRADLPDSVGWSFSDKYRLEGDWTPTDGALSDYQIQFLAGDGSSTNNSLEIINRTYATWHDPYVLSYRTNPAAGPGDVNELRAYTNRISGAQGVDLTAGNTVNLVGTQVRSNQGNIEIYGIAGINIAAAAGYRQFEFTSRWTDKQFGPDEHHTKLVYQYDDILTPASFEASNGEISLKTEGNLLSAGAHFSAGGDLDISTAQGDIVLGTYRERWVRAVNFSKTGGFFGSSNEEFSANLDATIASGNMLEATELVNINSGNDLTITSGKITANRVNLAAAGDLNIQASINSVNASLYSNKNNGVTITTIKEGFEREVPGLPEITSPNVSFVVDGDIHIQDARGQNLNASLLSMIDNRNFESTLDDMVTATTLNIINEREQEVEQDYERVYDLPGASDGEQFAYVDTLLQDYGATYHTIELRDHQWYDKQVQLNPAFQALLTIVVTAATSGAGASLFGLAEGSALAGAFDAGLANLAVGGIDGAITGNFDLEEILSDAALAGATSFVSFQVSDALGFTDAPSNIAEAGGMQAFFAPDAVFDRFGNRVVNLSVSNLFQGENVFEGIEDLGRSFLVSETLAFVQFEIGELGAGNANWEGSVGHVLLHGGAGCVALEALNGNCTAGFFSGASSSLLAGSNLSDEQKLRLAPVVGGFAGFAFSNGDAINVNFGSTISQSAVVNNYLTHQNIADLKAELAECEEKQGGCTDAELGVLAAKYQKISLQNDFALLQNSSLEEINDILRNEVADLFELAGLDPRIAVPLVGSVAPSQHVNAHIANLAALEVRREQVCDGLTGSDCDQRWEEWRQSEAGAEALVLGVAIGGVLLAPEAFALMLARGELVRDAATGAYVACTAGGACTTVVSALSVFGTIGCGFDAASGDPSCVGTMASAPNGALSLIDEFGNLWQASRVAGGRYNWKVSVDFANRGFGHAPYRADEEIVDFIASGTDRFVRVYNPTAPTNASGMLGGWMMRQSDIAGLSPLQIQRKFALPNAPTHIVDVTPTYNYHMRTGTAAPAFGQPGGGTQYQAVGTEYLGPSAFTNPRLLEGG